MELSHVDRPPLGDMPATIAVAAATNRGVSFRVTLEGDEFDPPLIDGSPLEAARRLQRTTEELVT
jgi:hypothetical protein